MGPAVNYRRCHASQSLFSGLWTYTPPPPCLFIAVCQGPNGGAHQPAGIRVAGADPLRALDQVVFGGHAPRQQDPAVHFGRIQGPVGNSNERHLGRKREKKCRSQLIMLAPALLNILFKF